jgi:SAM-dependent methyltransferase
MHDQGLSESDVKGASQADLDAARGLPSGRWWRRPGDRPIVFNTTLRMLRKYGRGRLLDVGCGQGQFARRASRFFAVHAVDISPNRVEAARAHSGLDTIVVGSATALNFGNESFDVVCALDLVEHLPDPPAFFSEARRVLRPGGLLLLSTPNPTSLGHRVKGRDSYMYSDPTHVSLLPPSRWQELLQEGGFAIVRDGTDLLWDPPYSRHVPGKLQKTFFLALAQMLFLIDVIFPWRLGENYWCLARAEDDADRNRWS